jgi:hypothetical protein
MMVEFPVSISINSEKLTKKTKSSQEVTVQ